MRCWPRPARCSGGCGICPRGWWCICCWPGACSPSWAIGRCGSGWSPAWAGSGPAHGQRAALTQARRRVGPAPLRALFDLLRGPAATLAGPVRWRGLLVCAIDGTTMTSPDSPANLAVFTKQRGGPAAAAAIRCCGWWRWWPAAPAPSSTRCSARPPAARPPTPTALLPSLRPGMLLLADRNFAAGHLFAAIAATGADLLVRAKTGSSGPKLPVLHRYRDGSYLSHVRRPPRPRHRRRDHHHHQRRHPHRRLPADHHPARPAPPPRRTSWSALYHERWEIETAYLELKSSILGGRVLRARTPAGIDQEIYALLITYQILRTAMTDATNTHPGMRPRPGQLHHRPARRPRPGHPSRRRHRRHRHRPRRHHRPTRPGQPHARPPATHQRPHRQTRHLQIQRPRTEHRPTHLPGHHQHQHPRRTDLDNRTRTLTTRHWD